MAIAHLNVKITKLCQMTNAIIVPINLVMRFKMDYVSKHVIKIKTVKTVLRTFKYNNIKPPYALNVYLIIMELI